MSDSFFDRARRKRELAERMKRMDLSRSDDRERILGHARDLEQEAALLEAQGLAAAGESPRPSGFRPVIVAATIIIAVLVVIQLTGTILEQASVRGNVVADDKSRVPGLQDPAQKQTVSKPIQGRTMIRVVADRHD
jgi:hypothetical protein